MKSDITQNLKTGLQSLASYGGTPTVELERLFTKINDRYPYVQVLGPYDVKDTQAYHVTLDVLTYAIRYYIQFNDEDYLTKKEVTYVTRNVNGDIIKNIMSSDDRGGYATYTKITDYGYSFELINDNEEFFRYVDLEVHGRFDSIDPSLFG